MRTIALCSVTVAALLAGCNAAHRNAAASATALAALTPCESREITLDGADVLLTANADSSLASVHVVDTAGEPARRKALEDVYRRFGQTRADTAVVAHTTKWGLTTWTDRCGRPITFTGPQPTSSPVK